MVAIEPKTGAVRVMASTPGYDPNQVPDDIASLNKADPSVLTNRAIQSLYPPGSTFKVVTAAAALDSGKATPDTVLSGASPQEFSGVDLSNAGGEQFGDIDMRTALTHSVNTYFAQIGEDIGPETLNEYMDRFGFGKDPEMQLPDEQKAASGIFVPSEKGGFKQVDSDYDIARVAIGQGGEEGQVRATVPDGGGRGDDRQPGDPDEARHSSSRSSILTAVSPTNSTPRSRATSSAPRPQRSSRT